MTSWGTCVIEGIDDNDRAWHEAVTGRGQEAWLLKQLYVERRFGRRNKRYSLEEEKIESSRSETVAPFPEAWPRKFDRLRRCLDAGTLRSPHPSREGQRDQSLDRDQSRKRSEIQLPGDTSRNPT